MGTLASLVNALEARSAHFVGHSESVATCAEEVARALDLADEEVEAIRTAGLLHDIGMIAIPDYLIDKREPLEPSEYETIQAHAAKGAEIMAPMIHMASSLGYVLEHHERVDGSGYPKGKKGDEISLGGQIVGLAEAWTAIVERRAYRPKLTRAEAMDTLQASAGRWFTEELLGALRRTQLESEEAERG